MKSPIRVVFRLIAPLLLSISSMLSPIVYSTEKDPLQLIKLYGIAGYGDLINPFFTVLLFFCGGILLGALDPQFWFGNSAITVAVFPVFVLAEVAFSIGHHRLFPIEICVYLVLAVPAVPAALMGATFVRFFRGA